MSPKCQTMSPQQEAIASFDQQSHRWPHGNDQGGGLFDSAMERALTASKTTKSIPSIITLEIPESLYSTRNC